jgi:hypothetical protein
MNDVDVTELRKYLLMIAESAKDFGVSKEDLMIALKILSKDDDTK